MPYSTTGAPPWRAPAGHLRPFLPALILGAALLTASEVSAAADPDLIGEFAELATMRPRACAITSAPAVPGWDALAPQCAWQGRLRLERWTVRARSGQPAGQPCVSPQAVWWAGARGRHSLRPYGAWQGDWTSQIIRDDRAAIKRLALLRQVQQKDGGSTWEAYEWTWQPSERAATRVWQQGRWAQLAEQAGQLAQASRIAAGAPAAPLFTTWEQHLGPRAGEIRAGIGYWVLANRCMVLDMAGIADRGFQLPYLLADSRREQRSAMQLQLARRYPKASWLRKFQVLSGEADEQHGRASYLAVWREGGWIRGQLWIPTKGNGPVLRMRIGQVPPPGESIEANADLIEDELTGLARRWRNVHD